MGADCNSAGLAYAGSNPARPNKKKRRKENLSIYNSHDIMKVGLIRWDVSYGIMGGLI